MLRLAFDFIITWRETRTRPNAYKAAVIINSPQSWRVFATAVEGSLHSCEKNSSQPWRISNTGILTE